MNKQPFNNSNTVTVVSFKKSFLYINIDNINKPCVIIGGINDTIKIDHRKLPFMNLI